MTADEVGQSLKLREYQLCLVLLRESNSKILAVRLVNHTHIQALINNKH